MVYVCLLEISHLFIPNLIHNEVGVGRHSTQPSNNSTKQHYSRPYRMRTEGKKAQFQNKNLRFSPFSLECVCGTEQSRIIIVSCSL